MSTTTLKRSLSQATSDAERFRDLFHPETYSVWTFAGSLRRGKAECADIEHVVVPAFGEIPGDGLFAEPKRVNLLWLRFDELLAEKVITLHVYTNGTNRNGEKYRGADFLGFNNEMFVADEDNYGATLAIRTGPADFSRRLVTGLRDRGKRQKDGKVWACLPCLNAEFGKCKPLCDRCDGTGLVLDHPLSVPTEREYLELCGVPWTEPKARL